MAIPQLPPYPDYTLKLSIKHPIYNFYIGLYSYKNAATDTQPWQWMVVTFDIDTLVELDLTVIPYDSTAASSKFAKPAQCAFDEFNYLWVANGSWGLNSIMFDEFGVYYPINHYDIGHQYGCYDCFGVTTANNAIFTNRAIDTIWKFTNNGDGSIDTNAIATYTFSGSCSSGGYYGNLFYLKESNQLVAKKTNDIFGLFNADTLALYSEKSDFLSYSFIPKNDSFIGGYKPEIHHVRNGLNTYNYINPDRTIEVIEKYNPNSISYPLEEKIHNTGNIIAWWDFDDDSSTIQLDRSGNKKDLSISGGIDKVQSIINGKSSCTKLHPAASANVLNSFYNSQQTIECWLKTDTIDGNEHWLYQSNANSGIVYGFHLNSGKLRVYVYNGILITDSRLTIKPNTIYHFVFVRDGSDWRIYANGVLVNAITNATQPTSGYDYTWFHKYADNNPDTNDGYITFDTTVYYDKALTQQEIYEHYISGANITIIPSTKKHVQAILSDNPLALWQLNEMSGNTAYDYSGNNNHAGYFNTNQPIFGEPGPEHPLTEVADVTTGFTNEARASQHGMSQSFWNVEGSLECWFKIDQFVDAWGRLLSIGYEGSNSAIIINQYDTTGSLTLSSWGTDVIFLTPVLGDWYHLVFTKSGTQLNIYINGELVGSNSSFDPTISLNRILIGDGFNDTNQNQEKLDNHISNLALYDYILTEQQIKTHYYASFDQNDYVSLILNRNPIMFCPCYDVTSSQLIDITGNENHITTTNVLFEQSGIDGNNCVYVGDDTSWMTTTASVLPANSQQFSLEFWIKTTDFIGSTNQSCAYAILSNSSYSDFIGCYIVDLSSSVFGKLGKNINGWDELSLYHKHNLNKWTQLVITYDNVNNIWNLFMNGKLIASRLTDNEVLQFDSFLRFGAILDNTGTKPERVDSYYQYISFYDRILTNQEILDSYNLLSETSGITTDDYSTLILQDNPVCYWKLSEDSGNIINDEIGNCNGIITNGSANIMSVVGLNLSNPMEKCLQFNGTNQYIKLEESLIPFLSIGSFTMEALIWVDSLDSVKRGILSSTEQGGFNLTLSSTNQIYSNIYHREDGGYLPVGSSDVISDNKLYHIATTFDGIAKNTYINGVLVSTEVASQSGNIGFTTNSLCLIGAEPNASVENFWKGKIAHVVIYDKVLTQQDFRNRFLTATGHSTITIDDYRFFIESRNPIAFHQGNADCSRSGWFVDSSGTFDYGVSTTTNAYQKSTLTSNDKPSVGGVAINSSQNIDDKSSYKQDVSIEFWVKRLTDTSNTLIFTSLISGETIDTNIFLMIGFEVDKIYFGHEYSGGSNEFFTSTETIGMGEIAHITLIRDTTASVYKLYINGKFSESFSYTGSVDSTHDTTYFGFHNQFSHFAVYDRILTDIEIEDSYRAGLIKSAIPEEILKIPFNEIPAKEIFNDGIGVSTGTQTLVDDQHSNTQSATLFTNGAKVSFDPDQLTDNLNSTVAWTKSIWIKPDAHDGTWRTIIDDNTSGGYWLGLENNDNSKLYVNIGGQVSVSGLILENWNKITLTYDGVGEIRIYINGVYKNSLMNVADDFSGITLLFGGSNLSNEYFKGVLSDFKWYNYKMTDKQVYDSYFFDDIQTYRIFGSVTQDDIPVDRTVRIYDRKTGELIKESTSPNGTFDIRFENIEIKDYYVVVLDDEILPKLNPISHDWIKPTI